MEDKTKELAVQALNDLFESMSYYANVRPCCTEEFISNLEYIGALSEAITAVHPIALSANLADLLGR